MRAHELFEGVSPEEFKVLAYLIRNGASKSIPAGRRLTQEMLTQGLIRFREGLWTATRTGLGEHEKAEVVAKGGGWRLPFRRP